MIEDSEAGRASADLAERTIPLGWTYVYQPMEVVRQSLEAVRIEGPATAKLQIDESCSDARELAQALDARMEASYYDALGLCVYQVKEDNDFSTDDIKSYLKLAAVLG